MLRVTQLTNIIAILPIGWIYQVLWETNKQTGINKSNYTGTS